MTEPDQTIINATMKGYMAGLADRENTNPYAYIQSEAWSWQHGYEQGRLHRAKSEVRDQIKPVPPESRALEFLEPPPHSTRLQELTDWMMRHMHQRNHVRTHEWAKKQLEGKTP